MRASALSDGARELREWARIPGQGLPCPKDNCGEVHATKVCRAVHREGPDGHDITLVTERCRDRSCPTGWRGWTRQAADRIEDRLLGGHRAYRDADVHLGRINHVIVSPPPAVADRYPETPDGVGQLTRDVYEIARIAGLEGGAAIPHLWRIPDDIKDRLRDAGYGRRDEGEDRDRAKGGLWQGIHDDALDLDAWDAYAEHSPHGHLLAVGYLVPAEDFERLTAQIEAVAHANGRTIGKELQLLRRRARRRADRDEISRGDARQLELEELIDGVQPRAGHGWVYKNKGGRESIAGSAHYFLTHAAIAPRENAVTWFGRYANAKLSIETVEEICETDTCRCGQPRWVIPFDAYGHLDHDAAEPALERTERTTYSVRGVVEGRGDRPPPMEDDRHG